MIDTRCKDLINFRFALRKRSSEMFGKPGESFGRSKLFTGNVCRGACHFQSNRVTVIYFPHFIFSQSRNIEIGYAENLTFGNIHSGIQIDDIGRRTVCLIAGNGSVTVRPGSPLLCKISKQHLTQCLTIIGNYPAGDVSFSFSQKFREIIFQFVSPSLLKLFQESRCPVGIIHFVGVVEERVWV